MKKIFFLPATLAHMIHGQFHTGKHRQSFGFIIAFSGVMLVEPLSHIPLPGFHWIGEFIGFTIHAIGLTPFLSKFEHH